MGVALTTERWRTKDMRLAFCFHLSVPHLSVWSAPIFLSVSGRARLFAQIMQAVVRFTDVAVLTLNDTHHIGR